MARRPRSHQIEDESIIATKAALPSRWVTRDKSHDYGVDLEVEIFDSDEESTGLIFYIQVKATDSSNPLEITLSKDYLINLDAYDVPTIIVRYGSKEKSLHWNWVSNLLIQIPPDQKSKKFHFDAGNLLDEDAIHVIEASMVANRQISNIGPNESLTVFLQFEEVGGRRKLEISKALSDIANCEDRPVRFENIFDDVGLDSPLVSIHPTEVRVRMGPRRTATIVIDDELSSSEVAARVAYSLVFFIDLFGLDSHASRFANNILEIGFATTSRALAASAVQVLINEPDTAVDLAILNLLPNVQDEHYLSVLFGLYSRSHDSLNVNKQAVRFLDRALDAAVAIGQGTEATVLYSMANAARRIDPKFAFSLYMRAKRKQPEYVFADYFIREVAGTLFLLSRYSCARNLYLTCSLDEKSELDMLVSGDACLFAGDTVEAQRRLKLAAESEDLRIVSEASVKLWLAQQKQFCDTIDFSSSGLATRFNGAVSLVNEGQHAEALADFLICCLSVPGDHESWINSVLCCHNLRDTSLYVDVLLCGFSFEGHSLLDSFIAKFNEIDAPDEFYDVVHRVFASLDDQNENATLVRGFGSESELSFDIAGEPEVDPT